MPAARRLLILNPNTSATITAKLLDHARRAAPAGVALEAMTAEEGPDYIRNAVDLAVAATMVERIAEGLAANPPDAVLLACFGDPGAAAARQRLARPVIGMAEAACAAAAAGGRRFSIVTAGRDWGPILEAFVHDRGLGRSLVSVETLDFSGDEAAADPSAAEPAIREAALRAEGKGAAAIILGGAGLAGFAPALRPGLGAPVLDSLDAALEAAFAAL